MFSSQNLMYLFTFSVNIFFLLHATIEYTRRSWKKMKRPWKKNQITDIMRIYVEQTATEPK